MSRTDSIDPARRRFLLSSASLALVAAAVPHFARAAVPEVTIENFSAAGKDLGRANVPKVIKSEAEWRKLLSPEQFEVTRHADTEQAFTGIYWNNHADGLYRCICCDTALFDSRTKFESGTGWPSFWQPISPMNVVEQHDTSFFMDRTAIACKRCDAHLGHVFDDGPKPTGLRYCMNSASLKFVKRA
ncbi:MAG TPA: peptide-methionine (R)-S-oxide reductase MsrB [Rhizomicrobium sp.]|nr:peptide-methionine (R)-S-oxide reductase MsrB [Rhizomicrobium sp.]